MLGGPDGVSRHMLSRAPAARVLARRFFLFLASSAPHTAVTIEPGTFAWGVDREAAKIQGGHVRV